MRDPHFRARELVQRVEIKGRPLRIPAILPRLNATPGGTRWPGPEVVSHTARSSSNLSALTPKSMGAGATGR